MFYSIEPQLEEYLLPYLVKGSVKTSLKEAEELVRINEGLTSLIRRNLQFCRTQGRLKKFYHAWIKCCHSDKKLSDFVFEGKLIISQQMMRNINLLLDDDDGFFRILYSAYTSMHPSAKGTWQVWLNELLKTPQFRGLDRFPPAISLLIGILPLLYGASSLVLAGSLMVAKGFGANPFSLTSQVIFLFPVTCMVLGAVTSFLKNYLQSLLNLMEGSEPPLEELSWGAEVRKRILQPLKNLTRSQGAKSARAYAIGIGALIAFTIESLVYVVTQSLIISYLKMVNLWFDYKQLLDIQANWQTLKTWCQSGFGLKKLISEMCQTEQPILLLEHRNSMDETKRQPRREEDKDKTMRFTTSNPASTRLPTTSQLSKSPLPSQIKLVRGRRPVRS